MSVTQALYGFFNDSRFLARKSSQSFLHRFDCICIVLGIAMLKDDITFELGQRWATALKKRFPEKNRVKLVANCFDVEFITARSWLNGQAPYCKYVFIGGQKFGASFVAEIFTPNNAWLKLNIIDEALTDLENKICQLLQEISALRKGDRK